MVVMDCIVLIEKRGAERDAKKGLILSLGWDSLGSGSQEMMVLYNTKM